MIPGDKSYYPGTDILINRFDIRDEAKLRAVEYKYTTAREAQLRSGPAPKAFDFEQLKAIHKHLFQDVYEWAGKMREIDFAKRSQETGLVSKFIPAIVVDIKAEELDQLIAGKNQLKGMNKVDFVNALTEVQVKLNALHPFREGNGRSARVFLTQLAEQAGYELDLTKIDKNRWNLASHRAMPQYDRKDEANPLPPNPGELRQIFHEAVRPTLVHAFTVETRAQAITLRPELAQAFARLDAIEQFGARMPGRDSERLKELERGRIIEKLSAGSVPPLHSYLQGRFSAEHGLSRSATVTQSFTVSPTAPAASAPPARGMRM